MAGNGKVSSKDADGFITETVNIRGKDYTFRELTAGDYNDLIELYTKDDIVDSAGVTRGMAVKSLQSPTMSNAELMALPFTVYSKLIGTVNKMHFGQEEESPNA